MGWVGSALTYLALGITAANADNIQTIRAAWIAMEITGWFVLVPLAIAALLTGLVMSLGTSTGLFRQYWTIVTLVLTVLSTAILVTHMPSVTSTANIVRATDTFSGSDLGGDLFHTSLGLLVLLAITALNVFKPRGMTPYGWRQQKIARQRRGSA